MKKNLNNQHYFEISREIPTAPWPSGGGQDKQISELIEIINLRENNKNIYYVAFLDGIYSNVLLNSVDGGSKLKQQQNEIKKYLSMNYNNFWVNTAGFKQLASDI